MSILVDLTGVPSEIQTLPMGPYEGKVTGVQKKPSRSDNTKEVLHIEITLTGPGEEAEGKKLMNFHSLDPRYLTGVKRLCLACGYGEDDLANVDLEDLIGNQVSVMVIEEEYEKNGLKKKTNRIDDYILDTKPDTVEDL